MDSNDPLASALRNAGCWVAGGLAMRGTLGLDGGAWQAIITALIGLGLAIWGARSKSKVAIIASAASRLNPAIPSQRIITDPATAAAIPSQKVTAS